MLYAALLEVFSIAREFSQNTCDWCDAQIPHNQIRDKKMVSSQVNFLWSLKQKKDDFFLFINSPHFYLWHIYFTSSMDLKNDSQRLYILSQQGRVHTCFLVYAEVFSLCHLRFCHLSYGNLWWAKGVLVRKHGWYLPRSKRITSKKKAALFKWNVQKYMEEPKMQWPILTSPPHDSNLYLWDMSEMIHVQKY